MTNWVQATEAALDGSPEPGVEVIPPRWPPVFDPAGVRALLAAPLAAFLWLAAAWFELQGGHSLDPLALAARLFAWALTVRAVLQLAMLGRRLRAAFMTSRHGLAISDGGLLLRTPRGDRAIPREDVIDVREEGDWGTHRGRRWNHVHVVLRPSGDSVYVAVPPFFERTPGVLAERLMRWRGPRETPEEPTYPEPVPVASRLFEEVAAGARPAGVTVVRHGRGWLKRGPYATVLLGVALLEGLLRAPAALSAQLSLVTPAVIVAALVLVPLAWIGFTWRHIKPRRGIALIYTPADLIMRVRSGMYRVTWSNVTRLRVDTRTRWSILEGAHDVRTLIIHRKGAPEIRYDEAFLGIPASVAAALGDAYKRNVLVSPD